MAAAWGIIISCILLILCTPCGAVTNAADCDALRNLYVNNGGASWYQSCGWTNSPTFDPCCAPQCPGNTSFGVACSSTCGGAAVVSRVTGLILPMNNVVGSVSAAAMNLSALTTLNFARDMITLSLDDVFAGAPSLTSINVSQITELDGWPNLGGGGLTLLDVSFNRLGGTIPPSVSLQTSLQTLSLAGNMLRGTIPSSMGALRDMIDLKIGANLLEGTIPSALCLLSGLTNIDLGGNALTGDVPECMGDLQGLQYITMGFNSLTSMPEAWWVLPNLVAMDMAVNDLTTEWPDFIVLPHLTTLVMELNNIQGPLPNFNNAPNLQNLLICHNNFSGPIPESLCDNSALTFLQLQHNNFDGTVPACMGNLGMLTDIAFGNPGLSLPSLDIFCNNSALNTLQIQYTDPPTVDSTIPACLTQTSLEAIVLLAAGFTGTIPPAIFNLKLSLFDSTGNALTGSIPEEISNVAETLIALVLPNNQLSGTLPQALTSMQTLQYLDVSGNIGITGGMPKNWLVYEQPIHHLDFHGTSIQLMTNGQLVMPILWATTNSCSFVGQIYYLDLSSLDTQGASFDAVVVSAYENMNFVELCPKLAPSTLTVLRMSNMTLTSISSYVLALFLNLAVLDLSYNQINSSIPTSSMPTGMVNLDLRSNDFYGGIPSLLGEQIGATLTDVDFRDNPRLGALTTGCAGLLNCLPEFLSPVTTSTTQYERFFCMQLTSANKGPANVQVDPAFYQYQLCACNPGTFGNPQIWCEPYENLCTLADGACFASQEPFQPLQFTTDFYPMPHPSNVTQFVQCRGMNLENSTACNASALSCSVYDNGTMVCEGNPCVESRTGAMCGACSKHYYDDGTGNCDPCPENEYSFAGMPQFLQIGFIFYGILVVSLAGVLLLTDNDLPKGDWRWKVRYVCVFNVASISVIGSNFMATWETLSLAFIFICAGITATVQSLGFAEGTDLPKYLRTPVYSLVVGLIKSQLIYAQILMSVGGGLFLGGSTTTYVAAVTMNSPFACWFGTGVEAYLNQFLIVLAEPLLFATAIMTGNAVIVFYQFFQTQYWRGPLSQQKFKHKASATSQRSVSLLLLYLNAMFYMSTSTFINFFACLPDLSTPGDRETYYSLVHPATVCFTPAWILIAIAGTSIYIVYFLMALAVMWRVAGVRRRLHDISVRTLYGIFYGSYHFRYWYYDGIVFARRLCVAALGSAFAIGYGMQMYWIALLLSVSLAIHIYILPFRQRAVNFLEAISLMASLATSVAFSYSMAETSNDDPTRKHYRVMVAMVNVIVIALYGLVCLVMAAGAIVHYFQRPGLRCCPRFWAAVDFILEPVHLNAQEGKSYNEMDAESVPLMRSVAAAKRMVDATSQNAELVEIGRKLPPTSPAAMYLTNAMGMPTGSNEREVAILAALRDAGLHYRTSGRDPVNS